MGGGRSSSKEGRMRKPRKKYIPPLPPPEAGDLTLHSDGRITIDPLPARSIEDVVIEIKRLSKSSVKEEIAPFIATCKEALAEIEARLA
jgi:hypothetical protein